MPFRHTVETGVPKKLPAHTKRTLATGFGMARNKKSQRDLLVLHRRPIDNEPKHVSVLVLTSKIIAVEFDGFCIFCCKVLVQMYLNLVLKELHLHFYGSASDLLATQTQKTESMFVDAIPNISNFKPVTKYSFPGCLNKRGSKNFSAKLKVR